MRSLLHLNDTDFHPQMAKNMSQLDSLCQHLEELGAVDKIEQLQEHENQQVYKVSQKIIDEFFGAEVGSVVHL